MGGCRIPFGCQSPQLNGSGPVTPPGPSYGTLEAVWQGSGLSPYVKWTGPFNAASEAYNSDFLCKFDGVEYPSSTAIWFGGGRDYLYIYFPSSFTDQPTVWELFYQPMYPIGGPQHHMYEPDLTVIPGFDYYDVSPPTP